MMDKQKAINIFKEQGFFDIAEPIDLRRAFNFAMYTMEFEEEFRWHYIIGDKTDLPEMKRKVAFEQVFLGEKTMYAGELFNDKGNICFRDSEYFTHDIEFISKWKYI